MHTTKNILKKYWGFETFRPTQEDIVNDILKGQDVFALLPTGGGKSLCYQLPGLLMDGLTIVISPLISLMQDQVKQLNEKGIKATCLYSGLSYREIDTTLDNVRFGDYKFLYVSPERIQTRIFIERFKLMNIALIVVDEAHCISQWGHDFRPAYKKINELRTHKPNVPIAAFTATATNQTKTDIIQQLEFRKLAIHEAPFTRENIAYRIYHSEAKSSRIIEFCSSVKNSTGIVYCQTRKSVKELTNLLYQEKLSCSAYHGGMSKEEREKSMMSWMSGSIKIMIATNAFGMGIDKSDVRFVIHYEISDSIEAYFQEAGRAGRDQKKAIALAFFNQEDLHRLEKNPIIKFPPTEMVKKVYTTMCSKLKIAYGSGKDEVHELELKSLCEASKLDATVVFNSLKLLELNGMISVSDGFYNPTRVKIMVEMTTLYDFEVHHEKLKPLTQYLIRKLPGIFENYKKIDLNHISSFLKTDKKNLHEKLGSLQKLGIIDYIPHSKQPTISFLLERPPNDAFIMHPEIYGKRKKNQIKQNKAVVQLLTGQECNAKFVLEYFDQATTDCGTCNHCVKKNLNYKKPEKKLLELCHERTTVAWLMNLSGMTEKSINTFVNNAQNEELIHINGRWIQKNK
jgi:ATP-dependent DNA helicase RecQ